MSATIKFSCQKCDAKYSIERDSLSGSKRLRDKTELKLRCKKCSEIMVIKVSDQPQENDDDNVDYERFELPKGEYWN